MTQILVCYTLTQLPPKMRNQLRRALYGSEESTHGGKYSTTMRGFLSEKKYDKPIRSTILVEKKEVVGVLKVLAKFKAKTRLFEVRKELQKKDL